jgi:methyltransferase (TIGR00027 family)
MSGMSNASPEDLQEAANWWSVICRANESDRPDALFRDPFVRRLATERGEELVNKLRMRNRHAGVFVTAVYLFDRIISEQLAQGVDMVISLAGGLDTRPYRMELPSDLKWVEIDRPQAIARKQEIFGGDQARCELRQIGLDSANAPARRELLSELGGRAKKALVIDQGYLGCMTAEEVGLLAEDLWRPQGVQRLLITMIGPSTQRAPKRRAKTIGDSRNAFLSFAPPDGPEFFANYGCDSLEVHSVRQTATRLRRAPKPGLIAKFLEFLSRAYTVVLLGKT